MVALVAPAVALGVLVGDVCEAPNPRLAPVAVVTSHPVTHATKPERSSLAGELVSPANFPLAQRVEAPRSAWPAGSARRDDDAAARLDAEVVLVARRFGFQALRLCDGRTADRPSS